MRNFACLAILVWASCGQGKAPATPIPSDDGGQASACEAIAAKAAALYKQAAADEGIPANLQADFIAANVHMVMADCKTNREVPGCVADAADVRVLERTCLTPLDEAGEVEGRYFSTK